MIQSEQQLNDTFAIDGQLTFDSHESGVVIANISNQYGTASLSVYGAHILSYLPKGETEDVFFVSERANYGQGKAIRGGIPICWPWFAADDESEQSRQAHGFARNHTWQVTRTAQLDDGSTAISLMLKQSEDTLELWPYEFELAFEVVLGESLSMQLTTHNTSISDVVITQALHSYFNLSDVNTVELSDLDQKHYLDKLTQFSEKTQSGRVSVSGEIDRVYLSPPETVVLSDPGFKREIVMTSAGNHTLVVWNPGPETIKSLRDVDEAAYQNFLCVETANAVVDKILVEPNQTYSLGVSYQVKRTD